LSVQGDTPTVQDNYDWRSTKPQRDMIYDTAGKMSKKEASLWYKIGRTIIENRPSERQQQSQQIHQEKFSTQ